MHQANWSHTQLFLSFLTSSIPQLNSSRIGVQLSSFAKSNPALNGVILVYSRPAAQTGAESDTKVGWNISLQSKDRSYKYIELQQHVYRKYK